LLKTTLMACQQMFPKFSGREWFKVRTHQVSGLKEWLIYSMKACAGEDPYGPDAVLTAFLKSDKLRYNEEDKTKFTEFLAAFREYRDNELDGLPSRVHWQDESTFLTTLNSAGLSKVYLLQDGNTLHREPYITGCSITND